MLQRVLCGHGARPDSEASAAGGVRGSPGKHGREDALCGDHALSLPPGL